MPARVPALFLLCYGLLEFFFFETANELVKLIKHGFCSLDRICVLFFSITKTERGINCHLCAIFMGGRNDECRRKECITQVSGSLTGNVHAAILTSVRGILSAQTPPTIHPKYRRNPHSIQPMNIPAEVY
jgi:hypothetical protein